MQITYISTLLLISFLINVSLGLYTFTRRSVSGYKIFGFMLFAISWWTLNEAFEIHVVDYSLKILISKLSYIGLLPTPVLFFLFTLNYTNQNSRYSKNQLLGFWYLPIIILILVITNEQHYLHWSGYSMVHHEFGTLIRYKSGYGFWVLVVYTYTLMVLGSVTLIKYSPRNQKIYKQQVFSILAALSTPWIFNALYIFRLLPLSEFDLTPISFTISGVILFFSFIRFGLLDVAPRAKESLFESLLDGVIVLDDSQKIIDFNPQANNYFNLKNAVGSKFVDIIPELSDKTNELKESSPLYFEFNYHSNDQNQWFDSSFSKFKDDTTKKSGYLLVFHDINQRKDFETQLIDSRHKLDLLNKTKDKFFSLIGHDIKNPLGSIISLSELISNPANNLEREDNLDLSSSIHQSAKQLYYLLENLLTWSRSQRGAIPFTPQKQNITEVILANIILLKPQAEEKKITVDFNSSEPIWAFFDQNMISTVLRNLLNNAIKFTHPNGMIAVFTDDVKVDGKEYLSISIKDSGVGMSPEDLDKLFRIDISHTTIGTGSEKGTGLGLVLCKEFVEKNGGTICADGILGNGSVFSFTLPVNE